MDMSPEAAQTAAAALPFALRRIPLDYPNPTELRLWVYPVDATDEMKAMRLPG